MRVLIVRLGALGDVVHTVPLAAALCRRLPDAAVDWVVDERYAGLLRTVPGLDRLVALPRRGRPAAASWLALRRSLRLGESIAPFRVLAPQRAVIPWDAESGELMDAKTATARGWSRLARWLEQSEALWRQDKRNGLSFLEQCDYYGKLSRQFPIAPTRIVYTKAGTNLAAAIVRDQAAVIDHKLYWAATENVEEARYLCGVLNSETLRAGVKRYQSQGQWGARDFDKYVFNLPIPRFDAGDALHRRLAAAAGTAEEVAGLVPEKEGEHFTRTRRRVRAALAEHGVAARLESLAAELLKG